MTGDDDRAQLEALEKIWADARQGAANVAGVDYQVAASAWLLVNARRGPVFASRVRPEGLEDIDCVTGSETILLQAKERAAGNWTRSAMASAIAHAAPALRADSNSRLVVLSNIPPGSGLIDAGLDGSLVTLHADDLEALTKAVQAIDTAADTDLVKRCSFHSVGRAAMTEAAIAALAADLLVAEAVAEIVFAVLLDDLQRAAVDQRKTEIAGAASRTPSDLDALAANVIATVDVDALDEAQRAGLLAPVDFSNRIDIPVERFLLGVDVRPGHVAANLDVLRADETRRVFDLLADQDGAVIAGPSGAGKSALMWRCAAELRSGMRLVELRRAGPDDVEPVVRWLRNHRAGPHSQIVVCVDDLGRPELEAWPQLAARLIDLPGVVVLASCREEDLTPDLLGENALLRPTLDEKLAGAIAAQLAARGVALRRTAEEAFAESDGLLLEYVALLATGERLERVVGAQVYDRLPEGRAVERSILRYVSAAHLGGIGVPFSRLAQLIGPDDGLAAGLARLQDEFLIRAESSESWIGLHEVRSTAAHEALHATPPPTATETLSDLLAALESPMASHLLRRLADRSVDVSDLSDGLVRALAQADAAGTGALLDAVIEVGGLEHARVCWQAALDERGPQGADGLVTFAYFVRYRGGDPISPHIRRFAEALPDPPLDLGPVVADALDSAELRDRAIAEAQADPAAAMLEAAAVLGLGELSADDVRQIVDRHAHAPIVDRARIYFALAALSPEAKTSPEDFFGPIADRLGDLAASDPSIVAIDYDAGPPARLHVAAFSVDGRLPTALRQQIGRPAFDLFPEIDQLHLVPHTPQGRLVSVPPKDEMDAPRSAFPSPRVDNRRFVAFNAAIDRIRAADSWTERYRKQAELAELMRKVLLDAKVRLVNAHDNQARRRQWLTDVQRLGQLAGELPTLPLPRRPNETTAEDAARKAMDEIVLRLGAVAGYLTGEDVALGAVAIGMRESAQSLLDPGIGASAELVRLLADAVMEPLRSLARVLFIKHTQPEFALRNRGGSATWDEAADTAAKAAEDAVSAEEVALVSEALENVGHEIHVVSEDDFVAEVPGRVIVVVVDDPDRNPAIWDHLDNLEEEARMRIAFRVAVLPRSDELVLPSEGWMIGSKTVYPIHREKGEALALACGLRILANDQLTSTWELLDGIVEASRLASWAAARRESGFESDALVADGRAAIDECWTRLEAADLPELARESVAELIGITERELAGETVVSQIVGHVLLTRYGDENAHSMLMSITRGMLVGLAARKLEPRAELRDGN
jgi:hypothetical protein